MQINTPQNVPGLQKLSPTSPRTKQTPRKNTNPIRTTSLSPATQTTSQSAVPQIDTKVTTQTAAISPSFVKPPTLTLIGANTTPVKPSIVSVVPPMPPKLATIPVSQTPTKPVQSTPARNVNTTDAKPNIGAIKAETIPITSATAPKEIKAEQNKNSDIKINKVDKTENIITQKTTETVKSEKTVANTSAAEAAIKTEESKSKQNTSPNFNTTSNKNQIVSQEKEKKKLNTSTVAKSASDQVTKTPTTKASEAPQSTASALNTTEGRVKRNRFKTIPYQSPTPEFELVSKISANEAINAHKKKVEEDKLTLFYK